MYGEDRKKNNTIIFVVGLLMTVGVFFVLFKKFTFLLGSNDDLLLRSLASGNYTGTPEAHLIYVMYPLGLIFKGLYSVLPDVLWFDGFMTFMNFFCLFLIPLRMGRVFDRLSNKLVSMIFTFSLLLVVDLKYLIINQYTVLAGLCATTAILWAATYNFKTRSRLASAIIIFMLMMSLWLRKETFFMALPILVLAVIFRIFEGNETMNERMDRLMDAVGPIVVLAALVLLSFGAEALAYRSPEWKDFKAYNEARTRVYDYNLLPDYDESTECYASLGLDETDYDVLREYDAALLGNRVDTEAFNTLADRTEAIKAEWSRFYSVPRKIINETVAAMYGKNSSMIGVVVTIIFFMMLIFLLMKDEKIAGLLLVLAYGYEWVFFGYFLYRERLPERVTQGLFLMLAAFMVSIFVITVKKERPARQPSLFWQLVMGLLIVLLLGVSGMYSIRTLMDVDAEESDKANEWMEINSYIKSNPDNVYVLNTSMCASRPGVIFTEGESEAFNSVRAGVWTLKSPIQKTHEARLMGKGIKESLMDGENVYYIMDSDKPSEWLSNYLGEIEIKDEFTTGIGNSYNVYSVVR